MKLISKTFRIISLFRCCLNNRIIISWNFWIEIFFFFLATCTNVSFILILTTVFSIFLDVICIFQQRRWTDSSLRSCMVLMEFIFFYMYVVIFKDKCVVFLGHLSFVLTYKILPRRWLEKLIWIAAHLK